MRKEVAIGLAFIVSTAGCAVPTTDSDIQGDTADLKASSLRSSNGLKVKLELKDGIKPTTKGKRFVLATFERGAKSFTMWCSIGVRKLPSSKATEITCTDYAATVSDDDNESLEINIVRWERDSKSSFSMEIAYFGEGAFYGDKLDLIGGPDGWDPEMGPPLLTGSIGTDREKDPFALGSYVMGALSQFEGEKIRVDGMSGLQSVYGYTARLDERMTLSGVSFDVNTNGSKKRAVGGAFSILTTDGSLASGYASKATIAARIKSAL